MVIVHYFQILQGGDNIGIGRYALENNTTGWVNIGIGPGALGSNRTGFFNVGIGTSAITSNKIGFGNTGIGSGALIYTEGEYNTGLGMNALVYNTLGSYNTAVGYLAGVVYGPTLTNTTAIGYNAIVNASNTMQFGNSAVTEIYAGTGTNATVIAGGLKITGGVLGVGKVLTSDANGVATWQAPTGGGSTNFWRLTGNAGTVDGTNFIGTTDNMPLNFRVRNRPAGRIDPFLFNTFYGQIAGSSNTTGILNVAIGYGSLFSNTEGRANVAIGNDALRTNTIGSENTAIGFLSNSGTTGLINSAAIGAYSIVNISNKIRLGDDIVTEVEGPTYNTVSDGRFKNNISTDDVKGLEFIKRLRPVVYNFDTRKFEEFLTQNMPDSIRSKYLDRSFEASTAIRQSGFIAQEVEEATIAVGYDFNGLHKPQTKSDNYSLAYSQFVVPLVKAVQELGVQNQALKQSNDEQAKINELLKKDMAELRSMVLALKNNNVEGSIKITENSNEAKLYQNAPNPFSKTTTIRYSIPANTRRAAISITSMDGIKIKSFELNSKGGQTLDISGGQLNAGTYIYTLLVDDVVVDSKKMILTK
jgi:trimeric autotransporter adhesin